jgi:hypothetical protein
MDAIKVSLALTTTACNPGGATSSSFQYDTGYQYKFPKNNNISE